jgi:hypothetical protein
MHRGKVTKGPSNSSVLPQFLVGGSQAYAKEAGFPSNECSECAGYRWRPSFKELSEEKASVIFVPGENAPRDWNKTAPNLVHQLSSRISSRSSSAGSPLIRGLLLCVIALKVSRGRDLPHRSVKE